jgi:hypothetical protein
MNSAGRVLLALCGDTPDALAPDPPPTTEGELCMSPTTAVATPVAVVHVHPSLLSFIEALTNFFKTRIEPEVPVAEKVATVVATVDPALAPEIAAGEAVVTEVEDAAKAL